MNADEDYGFDVSGYLHVPQGLTPDELAACNEAIDEVEAPQWLNELTPAQQAVLGVRMTGKGGTVISDGKRTWVETIEEQPAAVAFALDENSQPDPDEYWFWDVRGYLVLRGVMDEEWLAAANRALDLVVEMQDSLPDGHPTKIEDVPEQALRENNWQWPEDTSPRCTGRSTRDRRGIYR